MLDSEQQSLRPRGLALHWQIIIGLVVGAVSGLVAESVVPGGADGARNAWLEWVRVNIAETLGEIFMRLILMVVIPLVFCALVLGVASIGDLGRLGRVGLATLGFTVVFSAISVLVGIGLTNAVRPGESLSEERRTALREHYASSADEKVQQARASKPLRDTLLDVIPKNPLSEAVGALDGSAKGGGMLAVMFFALLVGIGAALRPKQCAPLIAALDGLYHAVFIIIGFAMRLAPFGVAGLVFSLMLTTGFDLLTTLAWYVGVVLAGLAIQAFLVYAPMLRFVANMNPVKFVTGASDAIITAFATSSSNATLPTSLRVSQENLGIRPAIGNFVLTVGSTANQNGTALYEGVTVLFLAQVFGVQLELHQQITVAALAILAGIGTAGVPGGSLPLVVLVLQSVNIPAEGIGVILGVDRLLDMCRTSINVTGDLTIAACVNRVERNNFETEEQPCSDTPSG